MGNLGGKRKALRHLTWPRGSAAAAGRNGAGCGSFPGRQNPRGTPAQQLTVFYLIGPHIPLNGWDSFKPLSFYTDGEQVRGHCTRGAPYSLLIAASSTHLV